MNEGDDNFLNITLHVSLEGEEHIPHHVHGGPGYLTSQIFYLQLNIDRYTIDGCIKSEALKIAQIYQSIFLILRLFLTFI